METQRLALDELFVPIVGPEHVQAGDAAVVIDGHQPRLVVSPASDEEMAAVLRVANEAEVAVIPCGGGTKLGWGNPPKQADIVLSTARLNRLVEHAHGDMTATVEAGMPIASLQSVLAAHGQMLALDPPWPVESTVGGVIATDASGSLRIRYGTMRDLLLGVTVALPDGTLAHSGGKVVKNVAGYDLMKLFTGSLGTLGVITSATLRLYPLPAATSTLYIKAPTAANAEELLLALNASTLTPTGIQIMSTREGYDVCVRLAAPEAALAAQHTLVAKYAAQQNLSVSELGNAEAEAIWAVHMRIYHGTQPAVVGKLSVLPNTLAATLDMLETLAQRLHLVPYVVLYSTGTGFVRFEGDQEEALAAAIAVARARLGEQGGHMVLHELPPALKQRIDVWGTPGDTMPLMRSVKHQFDPRRILNPGRYIGRL